MCSQYKDVNFNLVQYHILDCPMKKGHLVFQSENGNFWWSFTKRMGGERIICVLKVFCRVCAIWSRQTYLPLCGGSRQNIGVKTAAAPPSTRLGGGLLWSLKIWETKLHVMCSPHKHFRGQRDLAKLWTSCMFLELPGLQMNSKPNYNPHANWDWWKYVFYAITPLSTRPQRSQGFFGNGSRFSGISFFDAIIDHFEIFHNWLGFFIHMQ